MTNSYYPPTNEGRALWWENIEQPDAASALGMIGMDAASVAAIQLDAAWGVYLYRTLPRTFDEYSKTVTGYCHSYLDSPVNAPLVSLTAPPAMPPAPGLVAPGIEARRVLWVKEVKGKIGYDPAIHGATLRLETTGTPFDPAAYQAVIFGLASIASSTVTAKFRKAAGNIDAVGFRGRKSGGAWIDLGRFMATPATLHIPIAIAGQPEEWEIQGQAYVMDSAVGLPSASSTVLVRG